LDIFFTTDGLRAVFSGENMYSRSKNMFKVPKQFMAEWPKIVLDGELCCGRDKFKESISLVKNHSASYERYVSDGLIYSVFDAPLMGGTFEERINRLRPMLAGKKHIVLLEQTIVTSPQQIDTALQAVVEKKGEGLMLRDPKSEYAFKRSSTLLKVKVFHDAEAVVIGHTEGKGSNVGRCGALVCRMPSGNTFNCGSGLNHEDREDPPPIGSTITYRYFEVTKAGVPRFPSFVRIREDL
jgi:DNA ligase 1